MKHPIQRRLPHPFAPFAPPVLLLVLALAGLATGAVLSGCGPSGSTSDPASDASGDGAGSSSATGSSSASADGATTRLHVAVSVPPQAWLADRIGDGLVETTVLVPPGSEPHAYEPSPQLVAALAKADLYLAIGHPAFPFERRLLATVADDNPGLTVLRMTDDVETAPEGTPTDPHLWLDPAIMERTARRLTDALVAAAPEQEARLRASLDAVLADLDAADRRLAAAADRLPGRTFLTWHADWGALAARYDLTQLAVETSGREPGPRQMAQVIERARAAGVRLLLVQERISSRSAESLVRETGARMVRIDPLAYDWPDTLERVARAFDQSGQSDGSDAADTVAAVGGSETDGDR